MSLVCTECGDEVDPLAVFPGGICLECYKKTPEANAPLTADDIVWMWGGRTQNDQEEKS